MVHFSGSSPLTQREMERMALISKEKARRDRGRKLGRRRMDSSEATGTPSQQSEIGGTGRGGNGGGGGGTPSGGIVYSRPFHYQKRSNPGPRPTPTRLFKRTQSEQQFGRPIFQALPMPAQQRSSLPLGVNKSGVSLGEGSPTLRKRSPSVADLGAQMKDLAQSVKNAAEDELRYELIRFAARTTAHGIPMAAQATKWYAKWMWICISLMSCGIFIWSVLGVFEKFQRKEKIVSVQLRFDNVPFPAITVCNLNPFKREEARRVHEISETLDAYHQAVTYSKHADQYYDETPASRERRNVRGGYRYVQIEPVMSDCECLEGFSGEGRHDCAQLDSIPKDNISLCICNYDRQDSTIWPCYSKASWYEDWCPNCNDIGYCTIPNTQNYSNTVPCVCQKNLHYCLIRPERMKRMWEVRGTKIPDEDSPFRQDFLAQLKELGYENMTDEVAITTKTREKLVLTMASLHPEQRKALSYGRGEIIKMCSFNGQQCNIVNDFKLHADPAFGNCYTFNADRVNPLVSSRPGPSYGLRLLIHVNTSEYLPTTQAAGVRIVIHSQDEHPFPDAFGYSAPTNQLSSFGISLRKVNRLDIPHGECLMPWELPEGYIYGSYKYEPEGCYKSCYQHQIIRKCGCGDPRFPTLGNIKVCNSTDLLDRNCLMVESIKFTRAQQCHCKHPCIHDVYTTAFSSARLTTEAFQGANFDAQSAAMLEIYYEQMSHEVLTESESYLLVNFISDVGGQAGLWLGASILTLFEVIVFIFRILTIVCRRRLFNADGEDSRSFDLDEVINKKSADSIGGPKRSNAMHKSASTLTSLSAKASITNAKVSAAKSARNASLPSLTDSTNKNNNNDGKGKEKKKRSMGKMNPAAKCASSEESFNEEEDDESTPTPSKPGSRKASKNIDEEEDENGGFQLNGRANEYGFY